MYFCFLQWLLGPVRPYIARPKSRAIFENIAFKNCCEVWNENAFCLSQSLQWYQRNNGNHPEIWQREILSDEEFRVKPCWSCPSRVRRGGCLILPVHTTHCSSAQWQKQQCCCSWVTAACLLSAEDNEVFLFPQLIKRERSCGLCLLSDLAVRAPLQAVHRDLSQSTSHLSFI